MNLRPLKDVYEHPGPFASVLLDVTHETAESTHERELRWRALRDELSGSGAPDSLLDRMQEQALADTGVGGPASRVLVGAGDEVVWNQVVTQSAPPRQVAAWGPLPDLSDWVALVDAGFPFVVVVADRSGADVDLYTAWTAAGTSHETVRGDTLHLRKVPDGDWAQKRFQRATEEVWRRNARDVAGVVDRAIAESAARLVVLAGDVRARADIRDAVGHRAREALVEVEAGSRAPGSSQESLHEAVHDAVREVAVADRMQSVHELRDRTGQHNAVAVGLAPVLDALTRGQVDTVLLDPETVSQAHVDPERHPGLPLPEQALTGEALPADQVVLAAAVLTDAQVRVVGPASVPGDSDGVAALLRWDQAGDTQ